MMIVVGTILLIVFLFTSSKNNKGIQKVDILNSPNEPSYANNPWVYDNNPDLCEKLGWVEGSMVRYYVTMENMSGIQSYPSTATLPLVAKKGQCKPILTFNSNKKLNIYRSYKHEKGEFWRPYSLIKTSWDPNNPFEDDVKLMPR